MKIVIEKDIKCYCDCPYFCQFGGPGPVMACSHSAAEENPYIISHPNCDEGFPGLCPLRQLNPQAKCGEKPGRPLLQ